MFDLTFCRLFRRRGQVLLAATILLGSILSGASACIAPPPGIIAWWAGNGSSADQFGIHSATLGGDAVFAGGKIGDAYLFNGTNSYAMVADSALLSPHVGPSGEMTLEAWVYIPRTPELDPSTQQPYRIIAAKGSSSNWEYGLYLTTNAVPGFSMWQLNGNGHGSVLGAEPLSLNQWHHLAGVLRKGQFVRLYVNGQLASELTSFSGDTADGTSPFYIGRRGDGQFLDGSVDEVSLYGRALSAAEVNALFQAAEGKCPVITGAAVPYWTDFESGLSTEWMLSQPIEQSQRFSRFSGRFNNTAQTLTLTNLVPGVEYTLGFDFYALDSWEGSSGSSGDRFIVRINGSEVFNHNFANNTSAQSFPGTPDEGREALGFNASYVDSIYRNLEISFTASNTVALISFAGRSLESVDNESWGIDNVSVRPKTEVGSIVIRSTTLPGENTTNVIALESFVIAASQPLQQASAANSANYNLRAAGADGLLDTPDDVNFPLTVSIPGTGGRSVAFNVQTLPLPAGRYRFSTGPGLLAADSDPVPVFTRHFVIANPAAGSLETVGNDSIGSATPFTTTESPAGSGFLTAFGVGAFSSTTDVDYWRFDAEAGDLLTIRVEAEVPGVYPKLRLRNAQDQDLSSSAVDGSYEGIAQRQTYRLNTPGTYYLRVYSTHKASPYWIRLDQSRGPQMETEENGSLASADSVELTFQPGLYQGRVVGSLPAADTGGDYYSLGTLNVGNAINATILYPEGSTLTPSGTMLAIYRDGDALPVASGEGATLNHTLAADGKYYVRVQTSIPHIRTQYLLNLTISDGVPPQVLATSLPEQGTITLNLVDRFTLQFSEEVESLSISNRAMYEMRGAGEDGVLDTADDALYTVLTTGTSGDLAWGYSIVDGPLQPGLCRFTASSALIDRAGNAMGTPFTRQFTVANVPGYVIENRDNAWAGRGTYISPSLGVNGDGTISSLSSVSTPSRPHFIVSGHFNADTNLDLATANWTAGSVSIFTNNGAGVFGVRTNITTDSNPVSLAVADFNRDSLADLAVANYNGNTVTVLLQVPGGGFVIRTNLPGFNRPYNLAAMDLDGDGSADLAVPNYNGGNIAIWKGDGSGGFTPASSYATGSNPQAIASGDLNGDDLLDLVVANRGSSTLTILTNAGGGSLQAMPNISIGANPRFVVVEDIDADGFLDIASMQSGDRFVSVLAGNGDGTFKPLRSYFTGITDPYHMALVDLNGDGRKDFAFPGYGNNKLGILVSNGSGGYDNLTTIGVSGSPIGAVAGDFNLDGRPDLAFANYDGNSVTVWAGNAPCVLTEDPPGSGLRTGLARGVRSSSGDVDIFRFSANAGDQAMVAVEVPGNPNSSSLRYAIQQADGSQLTVFNSESQGWGQSAVVTLPYTGTYLVQVSENNDFQGEYRLRVSLARAPLRFETEGNGTFASADPVNLVGNPSAPGSLQGVIAGYLGLGDGGDYFKLGFLPGGSKVKLGVRQPSSSGIAQVLWIYDSTGALLTNSPAAVSEFHFEVPSGREGYYSVLVSPATGGFTGSAGTALRFSGGSDSADLGNWFDHQTFTLSMWLNPGGSQAQYADILDNNHVSGANWVIQRNNSGANNYDWGVADNGGAIGFALAANSWQHLAITRDATNVSRVYLNGQLVGAAAGSGQINYNGNQFLRIARWGGGGRNWNGMMDDLRIWDRALSSEEVLQQLSGSLSGNEPGLLGYWPFEEGQGSSSSDNSSGGHPAVLVNSPSWVFLGPTNAAQPGLLAQYVLSLHLTNAVTPQITAVTLPAEGSTTTDLINTFSVDFSEDIDPAFDKLNRNVYQRDGHNYALTDSAGSWWAVQEMANTMGGDLVTVDDAQENEFLRATFNGFGNLWMGLNNFPWRENYTWIGGGALGYSNWSSSRPDNNDGYEAAVKMIGNGNGAWEDENPGSSYRGIVEVAGPADSDGDGLLDALDPYPSDALNAFDLRAAGTDGVFGTADDAVYRVRTTGYSSGLTAPFRIVDGPLQPGQYRFQVTTGLRDRFGLTLAAPYTRHFTIGSVDGLVEENRRSLDGTSRTSLAGAPGATFDGSFASRVPTTTGANPQWVDSADLNGDGHLDVVTANVGADDIRVLLGNGDGTFTTLTNIATGTDPVCLALAKLNADTTWDLVVANKGSGSISILLGDTNGGFTIFTNYTGFSQPYNFVVADFNKDSRLDIAVPNYTGDSVSVLLGNGDATFQDRVTYPVQSRPVTVAAGDLDGDGVLDLATANVNSSSVSLLSGKGDGSFVAGFGSPAVSSLALNSGPRAVALQDVNGDGLVDVAAITDSGHIRVFLNNGDGTLGTRADYDIGSGEVYQFVLADLDGDTLPEAIVPSYGNNSLRVAANLGQGAFGQVMVYSPGGNPICVSLGDFNEDGRLDVASANYSGHTVTVLPGNGSQGLVLDPSGTELRIGGGRGRMADSADLDYWTFSALMGDRLSIAVENPGDPGSSSLLYRIYYPDGRQWTYFYSDGNGRGQIALTVPAAGTYTVRVEQNNSYTGEYRLRITLARPPVALEVEDNNTLAQANTVVYQLEAGRRNASLLGYIGSGDTSGDYYRLGNLGAGTEITLDFARPASSGLAPVVGIFNAAGQLLTNSLPGQAQLVYTVAAGEAGAYFARVTWAYPSWHSSVSNAPQFNGSNSYVDLGAWAPGAQWSVQAWVMPTSLPGGRRTILGGVASCGDWGAALQDGAFAANVRQPGGCAVSYPSSTRAKAGQWQHVAVVCDGTNAFLYIDGALAASGPVDPNYSPYPGGTRIGSAACCGEYFPGFIQDVAIWNRALSSSEIAGYAVGSPAGTEPGLLGYWPMREPVGNTVQDLSSFARHGTIVNSVSWPALAPVNSRVFGIFEQYLLDIQLVNTIPPQVVSVSLPDNITVSNLFDRFTITFSEDMAPATVTNSANYELRHAGDDGSFDTADDELYFVRNTPTYTSGTSASFQIVDGPLQPGDLRFTVRTNLTNPEGTFLPAEYVRLFAVANIPGFYLEDRFANSWAAATSLSPARTDAADGSFRAGQTTGVGTRVERITAGFFNSDTNVDLAVALWDQDGLAVLLGNGDGTFQRHTNYVTGNEAFAIASGYFNSDSHLDLAVGHYGAASITVLTGNGDGSFDTVATYPVGSRPYNICPVDLNSDGKMDLVVPSSNSGFVSVMLGNGDGTFETRVDYPSGPTPIYAAAGDVNGDGIPDVAVANYDGNNVTLFLGEGDGTFAAPLTMAVGINPRTLLLADLNNDEHLDLAAFNASDNTISLLAGNGDGSFAPRVNIPVSTSDGHEILAADFNEDGWLDLVVNGHNNKLNVLLNNGAGGVGESRFAFSSPAVYTLGNSPVGLAAADFNNDGRLDIAVGNRNGNSVSVLLGNDSQPLQLDPATGLRVAAGRGNLTSGNQHDYWSFAAEAGQVFSLACDIPGNPSASGLRFAIYRPDGSVWMNIYGDYYGRGQGGGVLPVTGTYTLRVEPDYGYEGEYRFRLTLAPPGTQLESEDNGSTGSADPLVFTLNNGYRGADVLGCITSADGGDYFRLGYLSAGANVQLGFSRPATSGLLGGLLVVDSTGAVVARGLAGAGSLNFTVQNDGHHYVYVADAGPVTAPTLAGASPNRALRLNGSGDWVGFAEGVIPAAGDFTVECWAFSTGTSGYRELISQGSGGNAFYLGTHDGMIRSGDGWGNTGVPYPTGGWHHLAIVKSSTNTLLYIDGTLAGAKGSAIPNPAGSTALRLGRQYGTYGEYWPGAIDEVRIWSVARTASDIQTTRDQRLTGGETGLVGYWNFDQVEQTISDATSFGRIGQIYGMSVYLPSTAETAGIQPPSVLSEYLLHLELRDSVSASIASVSLPGAGTTNLGVLDRFSLGLSKDIDTRINERNWPVYVNGGRGYTITDGSVTWYDAELQARARGGHLVSINDAAENAWLLENFNDRLNFWIGLSDEAQKGTYAWAAGDAISYTNWAGGQPDNSQNKNYASMRAGGVWGLESASSTHYGVIEVAGADSDLDGIPDALDPFPNDPFNAFDLRAAGPDGLFDTADDEVYRLTHANYSSGVSMSFSVLDGPLQPGDYRFMVTSSLRDLFGNPMAQPFVQYFAVADLPGYVLENRSNNTPAQATVLPMVQDPPGIWSAAARGNLFNNSDIDYWSFEAQAGDVAHLATLIPGYPGASQLRYRVFNPSGGTVLDYYPSYYGDGQSQVITLPETGRYHLAVTYNYGYHSEYRFRLTVARPPLQIETEENGSIVSAMPLTYRTSTEGVTASLVGRIRENPDLDYVNLGVITNGSSIFLNVRLPGSSSLTPVVSVYNAAGVYQSESLGGRPSDGVANVPVTETGVYYAVVRAANGTGGLNDQYVLDVNIVPTGSVNFPNLVVSSIQPPSGGGILSGQPITWSYTVANIGNAGTTASDWIDRAVLSIDVIFGNTDDIALGFFPHSGSLGVGGSYSATNQFLLPDGIQGDYYVIVQTDAGNAVNEYLFKGDNVTVSEATFHVDVAPYPDLAIEQLSVSGPNASDTFTITWSTANRGTAAAGDFHERFQVRNQTTGQLLINVEPVIAGLAAGNTIPHSQSLTTTNPGTYLVQVVTDSKNAVFEFNNDGHAAAEANNTATTNFQIIAYFNVAVQSSPAEAGDLSGAGRYASGAAATVSAVPVTNNLPYIFVNWTEGNSFQSANSEHTFVVMRDRTLTANFTLPTFLIAASNYPPVAGTVAGQGSYAYGTTNVLQANAKYGYRFTNWTEHGQVIASSPAFAHVVRSNRFLVANYVEANTLHHVTTKTQPADIATVTGAGQYTNGATATITAPLSVTNPPNIYNFVRFELNGASAGEDASLTKTFSTLDPTNMQYVAVYDTVSILPLVTNVVMNYPNLVPGTTNLQIRVQFNRSMDIAVAPLIVLTNPVAGRQAAIGPEGTWFGTALTNDTFASPPITIGPDMDGVSELWVSLARDLGGTQMAPTNALSLVVDATPALLPTLSISASNSSSATVSWASYAPPGDLASYRVYLRTNAFTSVAGLTPLTSVSASTKAYTFYGLTLDRPYYAAIVPVDAAGNMPASVPAFAFILPSSIPSPVSILVTALGAESARILWNGYNTSPFLGFAGFRLYWETTNFTTVNNLAPRASFGPGTRSTEVNGLDRSQTYYFAVVGFNGTNGFNPSVTTVTWSDPYAGEIASNLTLGGADSPVVDVLENITVVENAVLTIRPGTTLRFASGKGITVRQGALRAEGTALDPIVFTSLNDQTGLSPMPGDWAGVVLQDGAGTSRLKHVFLQYGAGLTVTNCAPVTEALTLTANAPAGLTISGSAVVNTTNALVAFNATGIQQLGAGRLAITQSVIKNNDTNAVAYGGIALSATQNWWGTTVPDEITAALRGAVDHANPLSGEPLLTPALGTVNNVTQVGTAIVNLRLACRTAEAMRLSEDSTFPGVFFDAFTNRAAFALSAGGGLKTVFAQFRSVTGATSAPVALTINYITTGPSVTAFNLAEGEILSRPLRVTGAATAPLGVAATELYVDGIGQATNSGGSFSTWLDIRSFSPGLHRVKLLARDNSDNISSRELNMTVAPTPPPAPILLVPASDLVIASNTVSISGIAEPFIEVRLFRSGSLAGVMTATEGGTFSFPGTVLVEGANELAVVANDDFGSASSASRRVTVDTMPPAQLLVDTPVYQPGNGLGISWRFPVTGKRATLFQVLWSTTPITSPSEAGGHTLLLSATSTTLRGLATGNYYFYVIGFDAMGNASPLSEPVQFAYDAVPPMFSISFDKPSPVGVGSVQVVLTASEALKGAPMVTVQPQGSAPALLTLTNTGLNIYEGHINVTTLLPSGLVKFNVSAADLSGNPFNGAPTGPALVLDVTPPSGVVSTAPAGLIQVTNVMEVAVNLQLSEAPASGETPSLTFNPPIGAPVPLTLSGAGSNWNGTLSLNPGMGSGVGAFSLTVSDSLGNVGHLLTAGGSLELYNTTLPSAPAQPVGFQAVSLAGGKVQLNWQPVPKAEIYRIYSEPGTELNAPTMLIADNIASNSYVDLPATDGSYRYVVAAARRGAQGTNSIVRVAASDRTPPAAPANVNVQLAANGLQISWAAVAEADHYNVYRNGTLVRRVNGATSLVDYPPRGVMAYTVGAADALGNEALSAPVTFQLLVGAVQNLQALVVAAQPPKLTWSSSDATAVGFNVYRNGIKQNSEPIGTNSYTDLLPRGTEPLSYAVAAVNATNAESAARSLTVHPVELGLLVNPDTQGLSRPPTISYFDQYAVSLSNRSASVEFPLQTLEVRRTVAGGIGSRNLEIPVNQAVPALGGHQSTFAMACATNVNAQTVLLRALQQSDLAGGSVIYERTFALPEVQSPGLMVELSANQLPLAGGLTPFEVRVYNRGFTPMYFATTKGNGAQAGDVYISVKNAQGQEVSRTEFNGTPAGVIFNGPIGYLGVPAGESKTFTVPTVFVPEALAGSSATFEVVIGAIYDRVTAGPQQSGPLAGSMRSSLAQTPYYGLAQTDFSIYGNDQPVIITGQAVDRATSLPKPNVPLRIGFAARGHRWYVDTTTDGNGDFLYEYRPTPGLAGALSIWAAHPEVTDQLNQAQINLYRTYITPQAGDIRMSINDTLPFSISILNPGDLPLTGFQVDFEAFQMQGTNRVAIDSMDGILTTGAGFDLAPGARKDLRLELAAFEDAPTNAIVVFTFTSAEGARAVFTGSVTLLPAFPVLSVAQPQMGYVEVSLNRGSLLSKQITVVNSGLKDLKGVTITPPTNVTWMALNLPARPDGTIAVPDIPVGQSNTFTVVFAPPSETALGFFQDKLTIRGTNSLSSFDVRLYARVTSASRGGVQFYVDDILGLDVANATVRLRSTALQVELPPVQTDINGLVTVTNLQEGDWSWQVSSSGHSANVGIVNVVPDQTVSVATRLNKSVVTINFSVVPVPYTDRYEIQIEQTFETHVPLPVLVLTPSYRQFENVTPGFQASFIVTAKNAGLIQMENLKIQGQQTASGSFVPLIDYVPVLLPQQSIEIPFTVNYWGTNGPARQENPLLGCLPNPSQIGSDIPAFMEGLKAIANAQGRCIKDNTALALAGGVAIGLKLFNDLSGLVASIPQQIANYIGCVIGTLLSNLKNDGIGDGDNSDQNSVQDFQPVGNGCFIGDTEVLLADGQVKPIAQVQVGDVLRSGEASDATARVTEVYRLESTSCREVVIAAPGDDTRVRVQATAEHLFWVDGRGWVSVGQLRPGDALLDRDGRRREVLSNEALTGTHEVFTFKLHGDVAFYANGVLVHDLCGPVPAEPIAQENLSN